jgi:hypothetical protein
VQFGQGGLVGKTTALGIAQHGDAAGIDDARDLGGQGRLHQMAGAVDIGGVHGGGLAHPESVIGGNVIERATACHGGNERP